MIEEFKKLMQSEDVQEMDFTDLFEDPEDGEINWTYVGKVSKYLKFDENSTFMMLDTENLEGTKMEFEADALLQEFELISKEIAVLEFIEETHSYQKTSIREFNGRMFLVSETVDNGFVGGLLS